MQIRHIVTREGVRGLYAGYGAFMLRDLPFDAIEFVAYEQLRKAAARMLQRDPNPAEVSIVGAIAGGFTGELWGQDGRWSCTRTYAVTGHGSCVIGGYVHAPTMGPCGAAAGHRWSWVITDQTEACAKPTSNSRQCPLTTGRHACSSCAAGIVTTPLDVLKTRLMTQGTTGRYKNLIDATVQIARTEGMGAFMSGWQPRLIWISLGGFVFFPALEAAKKLYSPDGKGMHPSPSDTAFVIEELEAEEELKLKGSKKKK